MNSPTVPAVVKELRLSCSREHAFRMFTERLSSWWPLRSHSCFGENEAQVTFDGRVNGLVEEISVSGERAIWGTLLEWDPPAGFTMTWHPGQDVSAATRLRVRFDVIDESRTRLTLTHDGWEARSDQVLTTRDNYDGGWDGVLQAYADVLN
jgi:hypothetical protein